MFPKTVHGYVVGMAAVNKTEFTNQFQLGVPLDLPSSKTSDIILLYNGYNAMPKKHRRTLQRTIQHLSTKEAVENCDFLNLIYTHHDGQRDQCIAIIPQYESYHIMKWMRLPPGKKTKGGVAKEHELRPVGRGMQSNGVDSFKPPIHSKHTIHHWNMLKTYLDSVDHVLMDLKPIVDKIKIKNTVIVMVCNHGQSELLLNFACSTLARGLDISNILVFATDEETKQLAESVGLATYYDERVSWRPVQTG